MHQVPSAPDLAVVMGDFDAFSPEELFDHFTKAELLTQWWPKTATVDLRVGGKYVLGWPEPGWSLRGEYTAFEAGKHLGWTWAWDHIPDGGVQQVDIWFDRIHDAGTRIGIFHGTFLLGEEGLAARQGVAEGWIHFGMKLAGLRVGASE